MTKNTKIDCTCDVELTINHEFIDKELAIRLKVKNREVESIHGWLSPESARAVINALEGALSRETSK